MGASRTGKPLDWEGVRARLARAAESLQARGVDAEQRRRVLAERARLLAAPPPPPPAEEARPYLAFTAGGERYGLSPHVVRAVARVSSVVRLPGTAPFVLGLMAWRGAFCPLVALGTLLGRAPAPTAPALAVVLGVEAADFALAVDAVEALLPVLPSRVRPPLSHQPGGLVEGLTEDARVLLDGEALLRHPAPWAAGPHLPSPPGP